MNIHIHLLSSTARTPTYATDGSAGFDIYASAPAHIGIADRALIATGISMAIPDGYYLRICPRSGLSVKDGIDVLAGVVDADYRGEVKVALINHGSRAFDVAVGDRIAQGVIMPVVRASFGEVGVLPDSGRGNCGFGSTGV
jgi:dUTP pyrophosphatase